MSIDVVVASLDAARREQRELSENIELLRELAACSLRDKSSEAARIVSEIKRYLAWVDDPRPAFSDDIEGDDKFSDLIEIARNYQDCTSFFHSDVGVNTSTVWRWSTGKSRPSRYVGKRLCSEVAYQVSALLVFFAHEHGLTA